jgi:hypothetical protein
VKSFAFPLLAFGVAIGIAAPAAAQRGVSDPRAFVQQTYAAYARAPDRPPADQSFVYSARLRALFDAYDAWQRRHDDLVGSLAFDWWTNSQDWGEIRVVELREAQDGPDRRTVTVRFRNYDAETTTAFRFVRERGRWFLDDAVQGDGGDDGWILSELLRERPE